MGRSANPGLAAFVGVAMFLVAWKLAPEPDSHGMLWVVSGAFAICGTLLMVQWLQGAEKRPSPWPGALGQILWFLRPRSWMIAWAAISLLVAIWGTPHLAWEYPPRTDFGVCTYVGLQGVVTTGANGGALNGCSVFRVM